MRNHFLDPWLPVSFSAAQQHQGTADALLGAGDLEATLALWEIGVRRLSALKSQPRASRDAYSLFVLVTLANPDFFNV